MPPHAPAKRVPARRGSGPSSWSSVWAPPHGAHHGWSPPWADTAPQARLPWSLVVLCPAHYQPLDLEERGCCPQRRWPSEGCAAPSVPGATGPGLHIQGSPHTCIYCCCSSVRTPGVSREHLPRHRRLTGQMSKCHHLCSEDEIAAAQACGQAAAAPRPQGPGSSCFTVTISVAGASRS